MLAPPILRRTPLWATAIVALACSGEADTSDAQRPNPLLRPERFDERAPETFRARFETSAGDFVVEVHRAWAPLGADRFYNLVKSGFFDDTRVYRVVDGFVAQFGLNGDPYVNQAWKTEYLVDDPVVRENTRGRVTFAKGGRHTRTTEVFINLADNPQLDENHFAPVGEVVEGMDVVDRFHDGYGDGPPRGEGPYQAMVEARGNAYLDQEFPDLTRIVSATLVDG
ncbi:MAG: peptidylprolyl isomerase [Gemmatimonadota bacterium]|nr:peptidylprolyl isomerase [Gemmatimonadota bacterium]